MPGIEVTNDVDQLENQEAPVSKPVVGIIYPPPEVRNIVDKTASFVARNGPEFETRIRQNEINNPKFNFLNNVDPYHAYYQHKVKEFKEGKGQEPVAPKPSPLLPVKPQEQQKQTEVFIPKEAPAEFEFVADPPSISAFDLDVVKLTAQFVARNGRQFLTNLMNREQRNYQFDFLRPQHSLFNYFTKLVEQYTKILIPPKDLLNKLRKEAENPKVILDQVKYRVEWEKLQERERKKEAEAIERERVAYAQIDWHDFVVVETVDFQPNEHGNLPPPTTPEEVGARILAQERMEHFPGDGTVEMELSDEEGAGESESDESDEEGGRPRDRDMEVKDMEEGSSSEDEMPGKPPAPTARPPLPPSQPQPPPLPPTPDQVLVRKDYNPKSMRPVQAAPAPDQYLISPITGEKIPAEKVQEHMRIGLLDPKWIEQRDRAISEKQEQEQVTAGGSSIDASLKNFAERRSDIFGIGGEETVIGKKIGEEEEPKQREKVSWDGHTASMEKVTQRARENISIEEQIAVIHKAKGLLQDEDKEKIGPTVPKSVPQMATPQPPKMMPRPPVSMPQVRPPVQVRPPQRPPQPPPSMPPHMQPPGMMILQPRPPMPPMRPPVVGLPRPPMPPMMGMEGHQMPPRFAPPPPQPPQPPQMEDEPPSKKAKTEDSLVHEQEWLRRNGKGPVLFKVQVPSMPDKPEWKLEGQVLTFSFPLTDNVSVIKAKLHEELGMPAGKQKLQYEGMFIKDSNTLAFYNFTKGSTVVLQMKERGGRKK